MRFKQLILSAAIGCLFVVFVGQAGAVYFPSPIPTAEWDLIGGEIFGGFFPLGSEVAAWDASGVLRFRADVNNAPNYFGLVGFFGPLTGSIDPHDFTWKVFDGAHAYTAIVHDSGTTWLSYQGGQPGETSYLNLDRDEPLAVVPEPATVLVLALLLGSGAAAGIRKRFTRVG